MRKVTSFKTHEAHCETSEQSMVFRLEAGDKMVL